MKRNRHILDHEKEIEAESPGYEYFTIQVDDADPVNITRHDLIKLISGNNTDISIDGKNITIASSAQAGDSYVHPNKAWQDKTALSGAYVISNLSIDAKGHPTGWSIRQLSASDIGAAASNHSHNFDKYVRWRFKVGVNTLNITTDALLELISSDSITAAIENGKVILKRKNKVVTNVSETSASVVSGYNNKWMNLTANNATLTVSGIYQKDDEIEGSFIGNGRLTVNGNGVTIIYSEEFHQNKIPKGGVFGLKFLTPTLAILFGKLIPVGL